MFYSQCLLSKKGPLGTIWVAAHFHKRLKKDQVKQTNIPSSVDKILLDEVPVVTYRILGYLLLGVVRIYSKKVDYLFHDCNDALAEICHIVVSKKASAHMEAMCAPYSSITLPKRFELDAFDLEVLEDASGGHVSSHQEIMLEDAWRNEGFGRHSFDKFHCAGDAAHFEGCSASYTTVKDIHSPHLMNDHITVSPSDNLSYLKSSMEKLRGNSFSLEECLDPMVLGETEEEPDLVRPCDEEHQTDGENINYRAAAEMIFEEDEEPSGHARSFDEKQHLDAEQINFPELASPQSEKLQITSENHPVPITIDVTPQSKVPNASGGMTPDFIAINTPAPRERPRVLKKRKCLFDDVITLPNEFLKQCIRDSSDLVCKRRKVPHTALHAWKACRISNLPQGFLEALIPCVSFDQRSPIQKRKLKVPEPVETVETLADIDGLGSPNIHRSPDQASIAPSTPVSHSTSFRFSELRGITHLDSVGPASSFEGVEIEPCQSEDQEFDISLMNEDLNSCEGDNQEKHKCSVRTRIVARYLHKNFLNRKKRREDDVVTLSKVLKRKTKKESARLFYELLVLKTLGYIDVKQDKAYDDIFVLETPDFKQAYEADSD